MYTMVIKAGLLFAVIVTVMSLLKAPPITDLLIVFVAGGVIPGTNFVVPADIILVTDAIAVLMIAGLLLRLYLRSQKKMRMLAARNKESSEDPAYTALVPGLSKALALGRLVRSSIKNAPQQIYFWLKYVSNPARVQSVVMRIFVGGRTVVIQARLWWAGQARLRQNVLQVFMTLRRWSSRARAYLVRVTTL